MCKCTKKIIFSIQNEKGILQFLKSERLSIFDHFNSTFV